MNSRKILFTAVTMMAGITALQAQQRKCDMAVTLLSPAEGAVVNAYASFNITVNLVNNGPDSLLAGDTVYYNTPSMFSTATLPYVLPQAIPSGGNATLQLTTSTNFNTNDQDEVTTYCVKVRSNPANTGAFLDTVNIGNNYDCNTVTFKPVGTTSVTELPGGKAALKLFPNPANGIVTLSLDQKALDKAVVLIRDLSGREISRKDIGQLAAGAQNLQLDVAGLAPGMYLVELNSTQGRLSGRLVKQ